MIFFGLDVLDFITSSSGVLLVDPKKESFLEIAFSGMSMLRLPEPILICCAVLQINELLESVILTAKSIQG